MSDVLLCNIQNCGAQLTENAWITTCRHVFCMKHGAEHFHNNWPQVDCPVCDEKLVREKEVRMVSSIVNKLCLAGLRPEKIVSQLGFSMKLWKQQLDSQRAVEIQNLTKQVKETEERFKRILHAREAQLDCQIATLESKCRYLTRRLKQKIHELELAGISLREAMATNNARPQSPAFSHSSANTSSSSLLNFDFLNLDLESKDVDFDTNLPQI